MSTIREPYPWEDDAVREAVARPAEYDDHGRDVVVSELADAIPGDAHDAMLTFRDPESRAAWVRAARHEMAQRVDGLFTIATEQRLDAGDRALTVTLAPEARLAADVVETLEGVKAIAQAGIDVAKGAAEAILAEHGPLKSIGAQSQRYPAGVGAEVKIERAQRSEPTVDADVVASIITEHLRSVYVDSADDGIYADGVAAGIAAVLRLMPSPAKWSITSLRRLVAELEATPDQDAQARAIRLTHAIGVRATGNPSVKITREETKR